MFNQHCRWIWLDPKTEAVNRYVCFRRDFSLPQRPNRARLLIAADSDYQVFINGVEIYGRQFSDYPHFRSVDAYEVGPALRRGRNCLAVLAYFRGLDFHEYRKGHPGLICQLEAGAIRLVSDGDWRCRLSPAYRSGETQQVTLQLGFTVLYDASREDGWTAPKYRCGREWRAAVELAGPTDGYWRQLTPRVLPQMRRLPFQAGRPIALGPLIRPREAEPRVPALAMTADFKRLGRTLPSQNYPFVFPPPARGHSGAAVVVDLGAETLGLLRIELDAPAGTIVDVAHGEQLEDMGVRAAPGYRRFADRFICRNGRNILEVPFRRLGCRYLELHILGFRKPVSLQAAGLYPLEYPVRDADKFESADSLLGEIRTVAIKTLKLCLGDHYFDCPWREQSLYAYDSRNQALYGYYAFGEYDYPQQSFRLLGWGRRDDGLLELCAPARCKAIIPTFSLAWISAVYEHWLFSGRPTLLREFRATTEKILASFTKRRDEASGLYNNFEAGYWAFYEWAPGLDYKPDKKFRLDAPHNLYLLEALRAFAAMLEFGGEARAALTWRQDAARLSRAIQRTFWDPGRQLYATYADRRRRWHYSAGVQALALVNGLAPSAARQKLQARLFGDPALVPMTLSILGYGLRALDGAAPELQSATRAHLRGIFGRMLFQGATSLWEVAENYIDDFAVAGSLCHAWSSVPVWLTQAYILGVRPLAPGFKSFLVMPHPCGLPAAEGAIPTPRGPIKVRWEQGRAGAWLDIAAPRGLQAIVKPAPGFAAPLRVCVNGKIR